MIFEKRLLGDKSNAAHRQTEGRWAKWRCNLELPQDETLSLLDVLIAALERQGCQRELIEQCKTLRGLRPSLYAAYMRSR